MSYYQPQPTKNRTALWVGLAVLLLVLAVGAYLLGRYNGGTAASAGSSTASTAPPISWSIVGDDHSIKSVTLSATLRPGPLSPVSIGTRSTVVTQQVTWC
jgi:hypothetical protein